MLKRNPEPINGQVHRGSIINIASLCTFQVCLETHFLVLRMHFSRLKSINSSTRMMRNASFAMKITR